MSAQLRSPDSVARSPSLPWPDRSRRGRLPPFGAASTPSPAPLPTDGGAGLNASHTSGAGGDQCDRLMGEDNHQRGEHGSGPVRDGMHLEKRLLGEEEQFDRHGRDAAPIELTEESEGKLGEHVGSKEAALTDDHLSGPPHERLLLGVTADRKSTRLN